MTLAEKLPLVSMTPPENFLLVSTTNFATLSAGIVDTGGKLFCLKIFSFARVSTTPVVRLELRISQQIFENI
jgi:hypothetical protein